MAFTREMAPHTTPRFVPTELVHSIDGLAWEYHADVLARLLLESKHQGNAK